jgi:hypothetical protein
MNSELRGDYNTATHVRDDVKYTITYDIDTESGYPWDEDCSYEGLVRESRYAHGSPAGDKKPHERPINQGDIRHTQFYFDWATAVARAREHYSPIEAVQQVEQMYLRLVEWCKDNWCYVCICIYRESELIDSIGYVETYNNYETTLAHEMLNHLVAQRRKEVVERAYWESRDVLTVGTSI